MSTTGTEHRLSLSAAFERLADHADRWCPSRLMDEGLDIARDAAWADSVSLAARCDDRMELVGSRPSPTRGTAGFRDSQPLEWFPWGLAPVRPQRFLLVADAGVLPSAPSSDLTLSDLGFHSCLYMPIVERAQTIGALQFHWRSTRLVWDDERGPLLRLLGRFLLDRGFDGLTSVESA